MLDPLARVRSWLGGLLPGAVARRAQVAVFAEEWKLRNEAALHEVGPLWVVLGDSSAQAIGASTIDGGYVSGVLERLRRQRDPTWRVVNLSRTGARARDIVDEQLPALAELEDPALVSCAVGSNDLLRRTTSSAVGAIATIAEAIPRGSLLATVPRGVRERRAGALNDVVRAEAARHGHRLVDLWAHTGPPWRGKFSADHFHPNEGGYQDWTAAFAEAIGLVPNAE